MLQGKCPQYFYPESCVIQGVINGITYRPINSGHMVPLMPVWKYSMGCYVNEKWGLIITVYAYPRFMPSVQIHEELTE
jgi:hypothetical protein